MAGGPAAALEDRGEAPDNVTAYDASYVALAERIDGLLLTCDGRLFEAHGTRCRFDLIA